MRSETGLDSIDVISQGKHCIQKAVVLLFEITKLSETLTFHPFLRDPLGTVVQNFVKGTSVMTGNSSGAPQDGDLVLCPHSLTEACSLIPKARAHTHTHTRAHTCTNTHAQSVHVPPPFQVTVLDPHFQKSCTHWRSTVHAAFLLNCKRHSLVTALCQEYPETSNRIQHCKKEWSVNLLITAGAMLGPGVTGFQSAMISRLWAADFQGKEEQELWCWHKGRCGAYFIRKVSTTFPRP
ncbi:unnamed protein product [Rangifer tarandus platyrhynchus]|uniref:Uncharacterized protein n=2 Tax=Rangifer tarandus platyrhynchus TaxID=3082113 RepID=A0AC59ZDR7_RANTA|nr:unnamed protein product [Rangifer tarandus platyrhynchus]